MCVVNTILNVYRDIICGKIVPLTSYIWPINFHNDSLIVDNLVALRLLYSKS
jgi:hypothetical protein